MSLRDFLKSLDYSFYEAQQSAEDVPCFATRYTTLNDINTKPLIKEYLTFALEGEVRGVIMFSVNENESNFKEWLQAGLSFPGATCTVGQSKNHGDYKCFLVCIPVSEKYMSYEEYLK